MRLSDVEEKKEKKGEEGQRLKKRCNESPS